MKQVDLAKSVDYWINVLLMNSWNIVCEFADLEQENGLVDYMDSTAEEAKILISKQLKNDQGQVDQTVLHELLHVLLDDVEGTEEKQVCRLVKIIRRLEQRKQSRT